MKKILLFAFVLILTACSAQPQVTSTLPPTSTPLPTPTGTPVPTITPTLIPTLVVFSPETWAGTTEHGAEFVSNLDLWKVDEATRAGIKCEGSLCYDADGKEIYDSATGQYSLDWLLKILPNSGDLGGPQYLPDLRGHPIDSEKSGQEFGVPTFRQFRDEYKQKTGENYLDKNGNGRMRTVLCDDVNNYWCLAVGKVVDGIKIYTDLVYRTRADEAVIRSIPIKHPADW